jgi:hypothetical protein
VAEAPAVPAVGATRLRPCGVTYVPSSAPTWSMILLNPEKHPVPKQALAQRFAQFRAMPQCPCSPPRCGYCREFTVPQLVAAHEYSARIVVGQSHAVHHAEKAVIISLLACKHYPTARPSPEADTGRVRPCNIGFGSTTEVGQLAGSVSCTPATEPRGDCINRLLSARKRRSEASRNARDQD